MIAEVRAAIFFKALSLGLKVKKFFLLHLLNSFTNNSLHYTPERNVTIDESLMLDKGRLGWIQYMWSMIIYTGKGTSVESDIPEQPITTQVAMALMKPLLNKEHCVTTDSFYTSPELANFLILRKTDTYRTLRINRKGVPPNLKTPRKFSTGTLAAY
ncbi:hypothetical protein J437_LFUL003334 [Ladona fulva]|uniref:PiggyBac transposable element-derived protein domain-containing protein n=1 Tax=Ladona fulva TaxID=123851 RepID=A0A8K0NWR4_LADFU|nr:hypothetical protein J437_LFUL003334 [Ladona fulva]